MAKATSSRQELNLIRTSSNENSDSPPTKKRKISSEELLRWDMAQFYENNVFSDVTFTFNENEKINAHKVVLAARCPYFKSMLLENPQEPTMKIEGVPFEAFQAILKYFYTGRLSINPSNGELLFEILRYNTYVMRDLELREKIDTIFSVDNVCVILNKANEYHLLKLKEKCYDFMIKNLSEILKTDNLNRLTQTSMLKFLERLSSPEIEKIGVAEKWLQVNPDNYDSVRNWIGLVRSKLDDKAKSKTELDKNHQNRHRNASPCNVASTSTQALEFPEKLVLEKNLATPDFLAKGYTLYSSHVIGNKNGITVALNDTYYFNHIKMQTLVNKNGRRVYNFFHRYYIEISNDERKWEKILDYTKYDCRSYQNLYFQPQVAARYVRIVGTYCSEGQYFEIANLQIYCKYDTPSMIHQIVRPTENVATQWMGAFVVDGERSKNLLQRDRRYEYAYHLIGGSIVIQLAQPYMISNIKLILMNYTSTNDKVNYGYLIETSVDKSDWQVAIDRTRENCTGWQNLQFEERATVYIKITGTPKSGEEDFCCNGFECSWTA